MYKTRALFEQALRYCRQHEEQMKAVAVLPGWHRVAEATPKKSCATPQATPNENMNFLLSGIPHIE